MKKILIAIIAFQFVGNAYVAMAGEAMRITKDTYHHLNQPQLADGNIRASCPAALYAAGTPQALAKLKANNCNVREGDFREDGDLAKGSLIDKYEKTIYLNKQDVIEIAPGTLAFNNGIACRCDDDGVVDAYVSFMQSACSVAGCGNRNTKFDPDALRAALNQGKSIGISWVSNNGVSKTDQRMTAGAYTIKTISTGTVPSNFTSPGPSGTYATTPYNGKNLCVASKSYCTIKYDLYKW